MTLLKRQIDVAFNLGTGAFGGANNPDTVEIKGLRVSAAITETGAFQSELQLKIWGMPLDTMRQLTVLNRLAYSEVRNNTVTIKAGDDQSGTAVVFTGTIKEAWADLSNPPDVVFVVSAFAGLLTAVKPIVPTSFKGPVAADVLFAALAMQITEGEQATPYKLENSGVTAVLDSPYFPGTAFDQIKKAAAAVRCEYFIDTTNRVLAIWPKGQSRGEAIVEVSASTGLVGYPQFTQNGIAFTTLFTPSLTFGQKVRVTSALQVTEIGEDLGNANGLWSIAATMHTLESEISGGQWFTRVECGLLGRPTPIIGTPS